MAASILVSDDIERGRKAIEALDAQGERPRAAFWMSIPDSREWRLAVVLPSVDRTGVKQGYELVRRILKKAKVDLPVWRVTVLATNDPLAQRVKRATPKTAPGAITIGSSTSDVVDDVNVDEVYVYRSA